MKAHQEAQAIVSTDGLIRPVRRWEGGVDDCHGQN